MKRRLQAWVLVLSLGGCALLTPRPPMPPAAPDAAAARDVVLRREREVTSLTSSFRLTASVEGAADERARGALAIVRPDRLRLQLFSLGFLTVFDYTVNGDRYRLLRRGAAGVRHGRVGDDAAIEPVQWIARLFLSSPEAPLSVREVPGGHVVERLESDTRRELFVPKDAAVVKREALIRGDRTLVLAEYDSFRDVGGVWLPDEIYAEIPVAKASITIEVDEYERNPSIAADVFVLPGSG